MPSLAIRIVAATSAVAATNLSALFLMPHISEFSGVLVGAAAFSIGLLATLGYMARKREFISVGQASVWLSAHVWISSAAVALALAHGRFSLGALLPGFTIVLAEVILVSGALVWIFAIGGTSQTRSRLWWLRILHIEASIIALMAIAAHAVTSVFYGGWQ